MNRFYQDSGWWSLPARRYYGDAGKGIDLGFDIINTEELKHLNDSCLNFSPLIIKCHVLVELKLEKFTHENIGQLNTYVNWYKKNMMVDGDNPPVGILLCTEKNHTLAEYALAGMDNCYGSQS